MSLNHLSIINNLSFINYKVNIFCNNWYSDFHWFNLNNWRAEGLTGLVYFGLWSKGRGNWKESCPIGPSCLANPWAIGPVKVLANPWGIGPVKVLINPWGIGLKRDFIKASWAGAGGRGFEYRHPAYSPWLDGKGSRNKNIMIISHRAKAEKTKT